MKYNRIVIAAIVTAIAVPFTFAAKGERKKDKAAAVTFDAADANKDGSVTKTEYIAAVKSTLDQQAAGEKFGQLDKDKDGKLTAEEYNAGAGGKKGRKKKGTT